MKSNRLTHIEFIKHTKKLISEGKITKIKFPSIPIGNKSVAHKIIRDSYSLRNTKK